MPRKAKPSAAPVEMPRTEADLDKIMAGIEAHKAEGNRLGHLFREKDLDASQVLDQAAIADARLYDLCDEIAVERSEEFESKDSQLRERRSSGG